jgi:hypothetical protein
MSRIHHQLASDQGKAMTPNACLSIKMLVSALAIILIGGIAIPAAISQPTSPQTAPPPPQPVPQQPQQSSYIGFGGVIGIQGGTTSLSQGTFSLLSKQVLTNNLAIHADSTIFGSLTPSTSVALTFNQPIVIDDLPLVFTPFLGVGIMAYDEKGLNISPLITGGIDINTPTNLTLTVRANAGLVSDRKADVGVLFGVGFNY